MREADLTGYNDGQSVSDYAKSAVAWAVGDGVLLAKDNAIRPQAYATRGDMAQAVLALTRQETFAFTYARVEKPINLMAGPSEASEVLLECARHWHLFVLDEENGWLLVRIPGGEIGYVNKEKVEVHEESIALPLITEPAVSLTQQDAAVRLQMLQEKFPDGKYWNNPDASVSYDSTANNMDSLVSGTPCEHALPQKDFSTCAFHTGITAVPFAYVPSPQCMGYASMLSDLIFGAGAPVRAHRNLAKSKVGDVIRIVSQSHSVVITAIQDEGFVVTECNRDFRDCEIEWGRLITWREIVDEEYLILTRYPEPESDGSSQILYAPDEVPMYEKPGDASAASTLWQGEFVYVIARQADGWYLVARESGEKGYVQAENLVNLYRAA